MRVTTAMHLPPLVSQKMISGAKHKDTTMTQIIDRSVISIEASDLTRIHGGLTEAEYRLLRETIARNAGVPYRVAGQGAGDIPFWDLSKAL